MADHTGLRGQSPFSKYESIRKFLRVGHLIGFVGKGKMSGLISLKSKLTHVAIIDRVLMHNGNSRVLVCESTTLVDTPDAVDRSIHKGVQMHYLSQRLSIYDGEVWWFPLKEELTMPGESAMQQWLSAVHTKKVAYDYVQAIGAGIDVFDAFGLENDPDFSQLFSSELCAKALQEGGKVDLGVNPSELTPDEVVHLDCVDYGRKEKLKDG